MNHKVCIPQSFVSLNLEVRVVSQIAGAASFIEMKHQTAAVD
jgi:hypothetical protein